MHVYEGELHELRAPLAARANDHLGYAAALTDAHACYTRFGMTDHALRVEALQVAVAR